MALIRRVKPDLVVGDFRLSLSVSARRSGRPYAAVTNAYWSPHVKDRTLPMPVLPITQVLPLPVAGVLFDTFSPFVARLFGRPLNQARRAYGLPALKSDLRVAYTDADHVLYADSHAMFDCAPLPDNHRRIGPILWAPPMDPPDWWQHIDASRPVVYLTLGSSGPPELLAVALEALAPLGVTVIASTAGAKVVPATTKNVHVAAYLPGIEAAARASLVICNGGSPTAQQALAAGVPVLGIASNMDQFLNMASVAQAGAGILLRADRAGCTAIRDAAGLMLSPRRFAEAAIALSRDFAALDAKTEFCSFVGEVTADRPASTQAAP